jgi:hypothetical protein
VPREIRQAKSWKRLYAPTRERRASQNVKGAKFICAKLDFSQSRFVERLSSGGDSGIPLAARERSFPPTIRFHVGPTNLLKVVISADSHDAFTFGELISLNNSPAIPHKTESRTRESRSFPYGILSKINFAIIPRTNPPLTSLPRQARKLRAKPV